MLLTKHCSYTCVPRTLLSSMPGAGVLVLAAMNRPNMIALALLQPGRFDAILELPPLDLCGRLQTLRIHSAKTSLADGVYLKAIAAVTDRFTGSAFPPLLFSKLFKCCLDTQMLMFFKSIKIKKKSGVAHRYFG